MTLEERLRVTLARRAEQVPLSSDAWDQIVARTDAAPTPARRVVALAMAMAMAATLVLVLATTTWLLRPGPGPEVPVLTDDGTATSTTVAPTTTSTNPTTTTTSTTPTTTAPAATCSASGLSPEPVARPELPPAVDQARRALVAAAVACDYERLAGTAGSPFTFSYGDSADPATFWRDAEDGGDRPLWQLAQVLQLSFEVVAGPNPAEDIYVWPAVAAGDPGDDAWAEVAEAGLYTAAELDAMRTGGSGYLGYRAGITAAGEWIFFVAGD